MSDDLIAGLERLADWLEMDAMDAVERGMTVASDDAALIRKAIVALRERVAPPFICRCAVPDVQSLACCGDCGGLLGERVAPVEADGLSRDELLALIEEWAGEGFVLISADERKRIGLRPEGR